MQRCTPTLGKNDCEAPLACDPRAGTILGLPAGETACFFAGCKTHSDCPVLTKTPCTTQSSVSCPSGQRCVAVSKRPGASDGLCALPGNCDVASGLCAPRTTNYLATAKVGDPCRDDTECNRAMRCEREVILSDVKARPGELCSRDEGCCSHRCDDTGRCAPGLCGRHARNGYCVVEGCAFPSLQAARCPAGSSCNRFYPLGLCQKTCSPQDATSCRGHAADKLGDYECRAWQLVTKGSGPVSDEPVCDFADSAPCSLITCSLFDTPTSKSTRCRDLQGVPLADTQSSLGLCLDDTASGPATP